MSYNFFPLVFRQKHIIRWGLMRNVTPETLSQHSYETAVIAHALALIGNEYFGKNYNAERAVTLALFHDAAEVFTGDLPTPVKYYNGDIRTTYSAIEENAKDQLISKLPDALKGIYDGILSQDDSPELKRLVKIADVLTAYIKCIEEEKSGNNEFTDAKYSTEKKLETYRCDELDFFMKNFLPSFSKSLDELQKEENDEK